MDSGVSMVGVLVGRKRSTGVGSGVSMVGVLVVGCDGASGSEVGDTVNDGVEIEVDGPGEVVVS